MHRLPFTMPPFVRYTWVNDPAASVWEPRLRRLQRCWRRLETFSISADIRRCAIIDIYENDIPDLQTSLSYRQLTYAPLPTTEADTTLCQVVIAHEADIPHFLTAWQAQDHQQIADLLGYPACCADFYQRYAIDQNFTDPIWPSMTAQSNNNLHQLPSIPATNILLHRLDLKMIPHLPCSPTCTFSHLLAQKFATFARNDMGFVDEMGWLEEMLDWPISWSMLHAIAEIKTPVFKATHNAEATTTTHRIHYHGNCYPDEGATGITFPYTQPQRLRITDSVSFQKGIAQN